MTRPSRMFRRAPIHGGVLGEVEVPGEGNLTSSSCHQWRQVAGYENPLALRVTARQVGADRCDSVTLPFELH